MRTIKPGKLAEKKAKNEKTGKDGKSSFSGREIWDDFDVDQKSKKLKSYEPGAAGRMVEQVNKKKDSADPRVVDESQLGPAPKPREDYDKIEEKFGVVFKDKTLLGRALTHRSALGIKERSDYERLEFLGDAVLDLTVAHLLSDRHPDAKEGDLSKMRAALVNTQALADVGKEIELSGFIKLGRGEHSSGGAERPSILADVMEAIVGAIYRDQGYEVVFTTIENLFGESLDKVTPFDPKTELQEELHVAGSEPPNYLLELVEGPEHSPTFVTVVIVDGEIAGRGKGRTKKASQQAAAAEALGRLFAGESDIELKTGQSGIIAGALLADKEGDDELGEDEFSDEYSEAEESSE